MAWFKLKANESVDLLNSAELDASLSNHLNETTKTWFQEMARGFSTARFFATGVPVGNTITLPSPGAAQVGPSAGFAWAVQRISVQGLTSADSIQIYRNSVSPMNFIGNVTSIATFGSKGLVLRGEERLIFSSPMLVTTTDVIINGEALEVSELDIYKVL